MFSASRKNDAVISVFQYNEGQDIIIKEVNRAAEQLTGYKTIDLKGRSLSIILPENIRTVLFDYLEFNNNAGQDLAHVLNRIPNFAILNKQNQVVPASLKIFYLVAEGSNPQFELLLRDLRLLQKIAEAKSLLLQNRQSYMDKSSSLVSKESLFHDIEVIGQYVDEYQIEVIFAIMSITNYNDILSSPTTTNVRKLIQILADRFKSAARLEDVVGYLGDGKLGVILFDCNKEDAPQVLNRLRGKMLNDPISIDNENISTPIINVCFAQIAPEQQALDLVKICEDELNADSGPPQHNGNG